LPVADLAGDDQGLLVKADGQQFPTTLGVY
jgi:hypothetical protein